MLDNDLYDPMCIYIFVECLFLVFSTNKLQVIVFFCKYQKKKKKKKVEISLKAKLEFLNVIEFLISFPLFCG